jgi:4,5-DOPA dioxygenase extradiol
MPVLFLGHGSPVVAISDNAISRSWKAVVDALPRPKAVLCVSAHWETRVTAVTAMAQPRTIHDFGRGLPAPLFDVQYPAPGDPDLARRVAQLLAPTPVALDEGEWGLDHGTWSVLVHLYPQADVPVVQLSMDVNLKPEQRVEMGRRLAPLRDEGVLILGSGNIVHNLRTMDFANVDAPAYDWATRFNDEIRGAILDDQPERAVAFQDMTAEAPLAAPTPEHYWPLLYILGARRPGDRVTLFNDRIEHRSLGMTSVLFEAA